MGRAAGSSKVKYWQAMSPRCAVGMPGRIFCFRPTLVRCRALQLMQNLLLLGLAGSIDLLFGPRSCDWRSLKRFWMCLIGGWNGNPTP